MSKKLNRWLRSTTGMITVAVIIVAAIVVAVLLSGGGPGTVWPPPPPHYPPPTNGYTCLPSPSCDETDGKFLSSVGEEMRSFGGAPIIVWIAVPGDYTQFEIGIFDGDSGKDANGNINFRGGHWDNTTTETTYTLYADPLKDGSGTTVVGTWHGNGDPMPNNAWYDLNVDNTAAAKGPSGHYYYRLEATRPAAGGGINAFKLRSNGYLSTGRSSLVDSSFSIVAMATTWNDVAVLYPEFKSLSDPGPSNYTGDWQFYFYAPNDTETIDIWDGDFDRGTAVTVADDTDDFNTDRKPPWAGDGAVDERAGGKGAPADDFNAFPLYRRTPPVKYEIVDPSGTPIHTNDEPSGTEEWENFIISTKSENNPDLLVEKIEPGFYTFHIQGLDVFNTVWIRLNYQICDAEDGCGPPEWPEGNCPRTIGYWKNNVKKILIDNKTRGIQETRESIEWALDQVAKASPLFRSGLNLNDPEPIATAARLTDAEANMILQRDSRDYTGDYPLSMLARALQQNLATWLNLASYNLDTEDPDDGKLGPTTWVVLNVYGGTFEGTVWEALQEAQNIILNASGPDDPLLERAKDIGDQMNNGLLGEDAADSTCADYEVVMPPEKQPPAYDDMPEAPVAPEPPDPTPVPEPDTATCGARVNQYNVESPTSAPFYGIKFEFASGTEVKNSDYEVFKFTLTQEQAAAMTSVQMEAKAGPDVESGTISLENCQFDQAIPCGEPVTNDNHLFAFYFMGAVDNGDGTLTLTFQVQNFSDKGLSHATIGLPEGAVPSVPTGSYQSEVCP